MTLELFNSNLNLIANMCSSNISSVFLVLQCTNLIEVITRSAAHKVCSSKLLSTLVFLGSVLCYYRRELGLTRIDQVRLCQSIGKPGLLSLQDRVVSDACWLFAYVLDCEDDSLIEEICQGNIVQLIVA